MTTNINPRPPELKISYFIAVILELCIVSTFVMHRSIIGILLCVAYAYFSACWALVAQLLED